MSTKPSTDTALLHDIRQLIDSARQRTATAVNVELTLLYWHIGRRISVDVLEGQRAEYGKQIVVMLSAQLTREYGKGWSEKQLHHCLRFAESFPDEQILYTLCRELSWSHLRQLTYVVFLKRATITFSASLRVNKSRFLPNSRQAPACVDCYLERL
ncbi:MAG: DUF1016 N-terminal domain-containing protein [Candidatus Competibacteraceae bacterium]|jgi:hypothetical protein|nr:DUF1016 N-terminal domain-containing protein [Candidatus Competibacteraceae bacterium]